ncbi:MULTISPECIES: hypothetical protein [unclassified Bradyrhizobium]
MWFALGPTIVNYTAFGQLEIASAFARLHERRKQIRISAIMIKQSSAKTANGLGRLEIGHVELGMISYLALAA